MSSRASLWSSSAAPVASLFDPLPRRRLLAFARPGLTAAGYGVVGRSAARELRHGAAAIRRSRFLRTAALLVSADKQGGLIVWEAGDRPGGPPVGPAGRAPRPGRVLRRRGARRVGHRRRLRPQPRLRTGD